MRCTKCGTESTTSRKFCAACGSALSRRCPKCGAENAPSSAYCEDCGAAFAGNAASAAAGSPQAASTASEIRVNPEQQDPSKTIDGERKTVTALFADIKGSMELMEDLDPEEARAIVDPAIRLMIDAVHRYDGYVVQSTGDGIFALFGAPVAHEDHPQRGLYAALRMQEELKRYSDRIRAEGRIPIQVRVGVNTGEVVVRSIKTAETHTEYTPIGHSTSLAARMQALAPIGSIAATEQVRKLCEGYFVFKGLGPTRVKGVAEPVNVYEVTGLGPLRTRLQRAAGRGLTKFVGREREMDALKHAAEQAKSGRGQIVAAMAEPGVGKSRLFFEFKATSQSGWMVLETFSVSHGKASAYLPVIDLLRNYFRIASGDAVELAKSMHAVKVPATVQAVLASRIDRLPSAEKELLQTLAVIGREFTLSLVRRVIGAIDDDLNRMLADLQMAEFIYEQPATGDIEYVFKHALTQEVSYNSVLVERRKLLHESAGQALESMFAGQLEDHLGDLAHHYSRSDNVTKAVECLGRAGQQATQRSAYAEAISSLTAAIDLLQRLPDSPERILPELLLQLAIGPALLAIKTQVAPEVERAYTRARELCDRLGDPPELFPALFGLRLLHFARGELRTAFELAEQLLQRAQRARDSALLLYAHLALGQTSYWLGELLPTRGAS